MPELAVRFPAERRLAAADMCASNPIKFLHSVASGDPMANGVLIWTRLTPADPTATGMFQVRVVVVQWAVVALLLSWSHA